MSLSVIILTHNEEHNIQDCIRSLRDLPDEIIVLDSHSQDHTVVLAQELGAKVFEADDNKGFGEHRCQAQSLCSSEYILHLDADERISESLYEELKIHLANLQDNQILALPRMTFLLTDFIRHSGWYPEFVARVYHRSHTSYDEALVHEHVIIKQDSKLIKLEQPLLHYSFTSFEHYLHKQANYSIAYALKQKAKGRGVGLLSIGFRGLFSFIRHYFLQRGFLDGKQGLWLALSSATYTMNKYLALYIANLDQRLLTKNKD